MFGRRKSQQASATPARTTLPTPPVDSDGKRRVFGEAIYAQHGDFLSALGFDINDPSNLVPEPADFDRMVKESLQKQDRRRTKFEAELLAKHGCNNIRPFFLFSEGVYNTQLGNWLIRVMDIMPYDDWNVTYLPMDRRTAAAMKLPLHPQQCIPAIEQLLNERLTAMWKQFNEAEASSFQRFQQSHDIEILSQFNKGAEQMRESILDFAAKTTPFVIQLIADVQRAH